jgi:hypothetical protein
MHLIAFDTAALLAMGLPRDMKSSNADIAMPINKPVTSHPAIIRELWILKSNSPMIPPRNPPAPARIAAIKVWQIAKNKLLPFQMESSWLSPVPISAPANNPFRAALKTPSEVMDSPTAHPR